MVITSSPLVIVIRETNSESHFNTDPAKLQKLRKYCDEHETLCLMNSLVIASS